jgi:hypothetical protein
VKTELLAIDLSMRICLLLILWRPVIVIIVVCVAMDAELTMPFYINIDGCLAARLQTFLIREYSNSF